MCVAIGYRDRKISMFWLQNWIQIIKARRHRLIVVLVLLFIVFVIVLLSFNNNIMASSAIRSRAAPVDSPPIDIPPVIVKDKQVSDVQTDTRVWIKEPPNMLLLQKLHVFEEIAADSDAFGTSLLEDGMGNKMEGIRYSAKKPSVEEINREVFHQWLKGKGRQPINWNTLIEVLKELKLHTLAERIEYQIENEYFHVRSRPYDHSGSILQTIEKLKQKYKEQKIVHFDLQKSTSGRELPFFDLILKDIAGDKNVPFWTVLTDLKFQERRLLITGRPGSGKTTLMRHIAKMWADGKILPNCQILFLLYLGEYEDTYHNLSDLLNVAHKDMDISAVEISQQDGQGTCFFLDAFDEKRNKRDFVYDMMSKSELYSSLCLLTSRPDDDLMETDRSYEIVGFRMESLPLILNNLTTNETAKQIVLGLWDNWKIREMCQLPLHMAMIVFIAQSTHTSSLWTNTQIFTAFMNATIKHYKHAHPEWNTISLRQCVLERPSSYINDDLCNAFKAIHRTAFEMTFNSKKFMLSAEVKLETDIKTLGFVTIFKTEPTSDEVMLSFSHPTFIEFFAAIHLITLSQKDQLFHVQNPLIKTRSRVGVVEFYFGLLGDYYTNNITALSIPLKQFSASYTEPVNKWEHVCPPGHYTAYSSLSLIVHKEIGWKGKIYRELLKSAEIGIDTGVCVSLTSTTVTSLHYILTYTDIHKLSVINYSPFIRVVSLEDMNHPLNTSHLELLDLLECLHRKYNSWSQCIPYYKDISGLEPTVTYYHFNLDNTPFLYVVSSLIYFDNIKSIGLTIKDQLHPPKHMDTDIKFLLKFPARLNMTVSLTLDIQNCDGLMKLLRALPNISTLYVGRYHCNDTILTGFEMISNNIIALKQLQNLIVKHTLPMSMSVFLDRLFSLKYLRIEEMSYESVNQTINTVCKQQLIILELIQCSLSPNFQAVKLLARNIRLLTHLQNLNLQSTNLSDNDLSIVSTEGITGLTNLSYLGLSNNRITGKGLRDLVTALKRCKRFRSLNLYKNPITGGNNIAVLSQLTNLYALHITVVSEEDKDMLYTAVKALTRLKSFKWSYYK